MKQVTLLGSTGSIGTQTLDIIKHFHDTFTIYALAVKSDIILLHEQVKEFGPKIVLVFDEDKASEFVDIIKKENLNIRVLHGMNGLNELASDEHADIVVNALVGAIGIEPTKHALKKGKIVALANKETIVVAGQEMKSLEKEYGGEIRPIDSEHSAIRQCMRAGKTSEVEKIWLTCSGGPFRDATLWPKEKLLGVGPEQALKHPTRTMGRKISIDSATLANKGLEVIEAMYLFDLRPDQIEVVIHPQSIIHSAVEFKDGSIIAELGITDMRRVIAYALFGENRFSNHLKKLSLFDLSLTFEKPDRERFPCLALAEKAARTSQEACATFNNVNEEAVAKFLNGEIGFYDIPHMIEQAMNI